MLIDRLQQRRKELNYTIKYIAQESKQPERTVTRIFSGETLSPGVDTLYAIATVLELTLDELFAGTNSVVGNKHYADLIRENAEFTNEIERLNSELALINAEASVLKDKIGVLSAENDILRLKLEHKEEIIAVHNYYIRMKSTE